MTMMLKTILLRTAEREREEERRRMQVGKLWYFQDIDAMMIFNPLIFSRYWWWYLIPWYLLEPDDDIQDMPFDNLRKTMILIYNDLKWWPPIYDQENDFDLTKGWDEEARTRTVGEDQGKLLVFMINCHDRHIDQLSWSSHWSIVMIITMINCHDHHIYQ